MPHPALVSPETILIHAREMIDKEGVEALSIDKLATALGIRAPSLYRHVESKAALLRQVNTATSHALIETIMHAVESAPEDTISRLHTMAQTYRSFALTHPVSYDLAFTNTLPDSLSAADDTERLIQPLLAVFAAWVGEDCALTALRGLLALVHGFVMLEINGQFRRGGDLEPAFSRSVDVFLAGWHV